MPPESSRPAANKLQRLRELGRAARKPGTGAFPAASVWIDGSTMRSAAQTTSGGGGGAAATSTASGEAVRQEALAQAARLEGANRQLRERLSDALQELGTAHGQLHILQGLQRQLEDATPGAAELAQAALEQERALQAARDGQVLQLLRAKDEVIEKFEARYAESRAEAAQNKEELCAVQEQLQNSQLRVRELIDSKSGLRQQLDRSAAAGVDTEATLREEIARLQGQAAACEPLQRQVQLLEQQVGDARADLGDAHRQLQTLADTVDAANAAITEVQSMLVERDDAVAQREADVQALQRHVGQLLGLPHAEAQLVHRAQRGSHGAGLAPAAVRIAALEAANERLEAALVEATRSAAAGGLSSEPSADGSDADAVAELSTRLAVATGKLQAAQEQVAQLEKLLKVAEATVLHNEVQLQENVEGRLCAEQQVHSLRLELDDGQALLQQLKSKLGELAAAEQAAVERKLEAQREAEMVRSTLAAVAQQVAGLPVLASEQLGGAAQLPHEQGGAGTGGSNGLPVAHNGNTVGHVQQRSLGQEVGAAVGALLSRISALEQQVSVEHEAAAATATATAAKELQSQGVQCDIPVQSNAAVQAAPALCAAATMATGAQTDAESTQAASPAVQVKPDAAYGRPDANQQQVAELTAHLAASRLAEVAAKADQAAIEARLQEAEHKLDAQAAIAEHSHQGQRCLCPAAEKLRDKCCKLQARLDELGRSVVVGKEDAEARLSHADAEAQARQQVLHSQLESLQLQACELRELRSSAYATVHRVRQALKEQGAAPATALPDGCEPGSLPQLLRQAADALLAMLQEHSELVAAFQQHVQQDAVQLQGTASLHHGGCMPLEASQRAVIRSLAAQVANLELQLERAGIKRPGLHDRMQLQAPQRAAAGTGSTAGRGPADVWTDGIEQHVPPMSPEVGHLVGMLGLLKQQLAGLDRIQQQLESTRGLSGPAHPSSVSPGDSGGLLTLHSSAHAAALLGTELPALHATVVVMEAEVRRMVAECAAPMPLSSADLALCPPTAATSGPAGISTHAGDGSTAAAEETTRRADKWKQRCKEVQAKLAEAQHTEAGLQARLAGMEQGTVQTLQQRVEQLAAAGAQLEGALQETADQLMEATGTADALERQLREQQRQHEDAMREARHQLAASEVAMAQQQQQHDAMAARLQGLAASVESSGGAEELMRSQLRELAEQVAVMTAAQEAAKADLQVKHQALTAAHQEVEAARAAHLQLAASKQQREAELTSRLEALQQECSTLIAVVELAETQHAEVEQRLQARLAALGEQLEHLGDEEAAHLPALSSSLGRVQQSAEGLEVRLLRLEAQAAVAVEDRQDSVAERWAHLVRSHRYRAAVKQLRNGLQAQLLDVQADCQQHVAQLVQLQAALHSARSKRDELAFQLQNAQLRHEQEMQLGAHEQQEQLAALQAEAEQGRRHVQQEAELAAAASVTAAEDRCRVEAAARACQLEQRALGDLELAEQQCSELQAQLDCVHAEFKRYQAMKAIEVHLLEQRVLRQMRGGGGSGSGALGANATVAAGANGAPASIQPASVADLEAVCCHEGIGAALREARLERLQREQVQQELAAAQQAGEQLGVRAKAAEQELATSRGRQASEARGLRERAESLAAELTDCQNALRLAKAEGSRRLKELQALQRQAAATENSGPNVAAQLEGEQQARKTAEATLREARAELSRKAALIKDLRCKVADLERDLEAQDPAPLAAELDTCQSRLRQAQAACGSKDAAVRELRERLEQQTRLARQQGALDERRVQEGQLHRLGGELAQRDADLDSLHQQLRQVHHELAATTTDLQEATTQHEAEVEDAAARLAEARQCMQQLGHALTLLLETLVQLSAAADAAAGQDGSQADAAALAAAAHDFAGLVDLAADDISSVLLPSPGQAAGSASAAIEATAQQAWLLLQQLEANEVQPQRETCSSLGAAVSSLREQCAQVAAALATWQSETGSGFGASAGFVSSAF